MCSLRCFQVLIILQDAIVKNWVFAFASTIRKTSESYRAPQAVSNDGFARNTAFSDPEMAGSDGFAK